MHPKAVCPPGAWVEWAAAWAVCPQAWATTNPVTIFLIIFIFQKTPFHDRSPGSCFWLSFVSEHDLLNEKTRGGFPLCVGEVLLGDHRYLSCFFFIVPFISLTLLLIS